MRAWWCVVASLSVGPAHAAEVRPSSDLAYERFEVGEKAFAAGNYDKAAEAFGEAYALQAQPAYLFNQALALARAERHVAAMAALDLFLARFPQSSRRAEVEKKRAEVEVARAKARAVIAVHTIPTGGRAELENGEACNAPCELWVDPGPVKIRVSVGERSRSEARTLGPRERWSVGYDLTPPPPPSVDHTGSWVAWGIGASAAAVGVAFAVSAQDTHTQGKRLAAGSPLDDADYRRLEALRGDVRTQSLIADTSFGLAVVGGLVGLILWVVADEGEVSDTGGTVGSWHF